jgi:hypothetical protein
MDSRGLLRVVAEAKVLRRHVLGCSAAEEDLRHLGRSSRMTFHTLSKSQWWQPMACLCVVLPVYLVR